MFVILFHFSFPAVCVCVCVCVVNVLDIAAQDYLFAVLIGRALLEAGMTGRYFSCVCVFGCV